MARVSKVDVERYQTLLASTQEAPLVQEDTYPKQQREKVQKDIWVSNGIERLHYQIGCDTSHLELLLKERLKGEIVEHMTGVRGMMQEALFWVLPGGQEVVSEGPGMYRVRGSGALLFQSAPGKDWVAMQELRWLEAAKASYFYRKNHFVTEQATLIHFQALGHDLITSPEGLSPIITGSARSAEFFLASHGIDFRADHLKATISTRGLL
ncbi:MAG: hypothetical protein JSR80_03690 [Verrucomicrobia bacterium]|nr:hypothetical protein [Verrucomicrobiota bacterium]